MARLMGREHLYRFADAITDLSCGITSQVLVVFYSALLLSVYVWIYSHWRLHSFEAKWAPWVIAFVGVDFIYYWWHRFSHEVNFLWAAHVVHHQSEDYNLAVALRQAVLTAFTAMPFYLPLALIGVPPVVYGTIAAFSTLYQFWIHTQLVPKLRGPIDWIFNLPSHHRVHHAINPRYLDKNYAATLIVWDRLFGTYEEETEAPVYGITKPLASYDPLWAQLHYWFEMWHLARTAASWRDKVFVWFASPAWKPRNLPNPEPRAVSPETYAKFDPRPSLGRIVYVTLHFVVITGATFTVMMWNQRFPHWLLIGLVAAIVLTLWSFGALLQNKRWATFAETGRLTLVAGLAGAWLLRG
ncbi:MAG TPA: sterol desaturase family protein [Polyangia bacterium]|nr:sterol desaturase family protein [Polyangia bacterium]